MAKRYNNDGTPRKRRTDCGFYRLPDAGKQAFMEIVNENRANPDMKRLAAVVEKYKAQWSLARMYDFLRSPRCQEELIAAQVRLHRALGETIASAGADHLHADGRRLAIAHWTTILASAQTLYSDPSTTPEQKAAAFAASSEATDKLVALGALKAGEDKGALASAKLALDREKGAREERKLKLLEEREQRMKQIVEDPTTDHAGKIALLQQALEGRYQ